MSTIVDMQLAQDILNVFVDRRLGDAQFLGDLAAALAAANKLENLALTSRQDAIKQPLRDGPGLLRRDDLAEPLYNGNRGSTRQTKLIARDLIECGDQPCR
jgi:hypothetical protein